LLAEKGITGSYETIRLWTVTFGPAYVRNLKRKHRGFGDTFYLDEVFININGKQHHLWRAVHQDGELLMSTFSLAARRFFKRLLKKSDAQPRTIITDKLASYGVSHRELMSSTHPDITKYANNRAEPSQETTRFRERGMRRIK
jgi:putative transposase